MFRVGSRVRQETPEEDRRTYRPKRCEYNNNEEDNKPKTMNDKNTNHSIPDRRHDLVVVNKYVWT